jgi:hypothetical protein
MPIAAMSANVSADLAVLHPDAPVLGIYDVGRQIVISSGESHSISALAVCTLDSSTEYCSHCPHSIARQRNQYISLLHTDLSF